MAEEKTLRPRLSVALCYGRVAENLNQQDLSERSGIPAKEISDLETKREPPREKVDHLFSAMGREPMEVDLALFCADLLRRPKLGTESPLDPTAEETRMMHVAAGLEATAVFQDTLMRVDQALLEAKVKAARQEAEPLVKELLSWPPAKRWRAVEELAAYRTWAVAERTAFESEKRAPHDADEALDIARLAVRMAELTEGGDLWKARVGGICWGSLANAHRVKGDFPASDEAFLRSDRLFLTGAPADSGLIFDGTWLLGLKASLRRHQGRFPESLDLLDEALSASQSDEAKARILLKKSATLEQMGDWQGTIEALEKARPLVERQGDARARCVLLFNLCTALADGAQYQEAERLLPDVQRLGAQLGNGLDLVRVAWLRARIQEGLGRIDEAIADLEWVRGEFASRGIAFDTARACLDLTALYLQQGRTAEVKRLADQMVAIFREQQVHREALAAVLVFHKAVEQERATVELDRRLSDYLRRAQHDPELRFEMNGD